MAKERIDWKTSAAKMCCKESSVHAERWRVFGVWTVFTLMVAFGIGCGSSERPDETARPASGRFDKEVVAWGVASVSGPKTVKLGTEIGYCVGDPKPRMRLAQRIYRGKSVYITVELALPRKKPSDHSLCGGVGLFLYKTIRLTRDLADVMLYDSSTDPPTRRWPR